MGAYGALIMIELEASKIIEIVHRLDTGMAACRQMAIHDSLAWRMPYWEDQAVMIEKLIGDIKDAVEFEIPNEEKD